MNDINHDALPFNLPAYSFLLHIYSAPLSHSKRDEDSALPSRPPRDALITMFIPLLQVLLIFAFICHKQLNLSGFSSHSCNWLH